MTTTKEAPSTSAYNLCYFWEGSDSVPVRLAPLIVAGSDLQVKGMRPLALSFSVSIWLIQPTDLRATPPGPSGSTRAGPLFSARNWPFVYSLFDSAKEVTTDTLDKALDTLTKRAPRPDLEKGVFTVQRYVERYPSARALPGSLSGVQWLQPTFPSFETPKGLSDKITFEAQLHVNRVDDMRWRIRKVLLNETYLRESGYPVGTNGREILLRNSVDNNSAGTTFEANVSDEGTGDRLSQLSVVGSRAGAPIELTPLVAPWLFGNIPGISGLSRPEVARLLKIDDRTVLAVKWHSAIEGESVTAFLDLGHKFCPLAFAVHSNQQLRLLIAYDNIRDVGPGQLPNQIRFYRAEMWTHEGTKRRFVISDSLVISRSE